MKVTQVEGINQVAYLDVPDPQPKAGEVLVKVHYTGICGSDIPRVLQGAVHSYPQTLGHEFSGEVVAVGEGVDESLVGTRASCLPLIPCGKCEDCEKGYYSLCKHYGFIGSRQQGSMAELVAIPLQNLFPLQPGVSDLEGAFFEPASVGIHGIELAHFKEGASAIVIGAGTIGILTAQALYGYGASKVVVSNHTQARLDTAAQAGLENLVNTSEEGWQQRAFEMNGEREFDYVFDTAGTPQTIIDALDVAANRATVCIVGTPKSDPAFTIRQWEMINRKELTVTGSWMSYSKPWPGVEWDNVNAFFDKGIMSIHPSMIDSIFNLSDTASAFEKFVPPNKVMGKIVIDSWQEQ